MQHYAFHIGDYAKATSHLSPLEDIAYRRLIDLYYDTEGHIPYDVTKAARRVRLDVEPVTQVLQEFFVDTGTEWRHVRCDKEMEKIYEKSDKARESGKRSGEVRRAKAQQTHSEPLANVERTLNERSANAELPVTRNPLPIESTPLSDSQANTDPVPLEDKKQKPSTDDAKAVIDFLNLRTGRKYRHTKSNLDPILARMREGYSLQEIRTVTMRKVNEWLPDEKMNEYLRPMTLYTAKNFNSYAGILT